MKNIQNYIIVLLFMLALSLGKTSYSQLPGYYGKRLSIGFDSKLGLALMNPNSKNNFLFRDFYGNSKIPVNFIPSLKLQYVLEENLSLSLNLSYFKTGLYLDSAYYNQNKLPISECKAAIFDLKFFNGPLAPIGKFHKLNTGLIFTSTDILDDFHNGNSKTKLGYPNNFTYFLIGYGNGKSLVLFDKVLIERSLDFNLNMPLNDMRNFFVSPDNWYVEKHVETHRSQHFRMLWLTSILLNVSVSFLAF